ncbi:MAG: LytTR family transcriptional regulator [Treponema sp.]|nr:LytTR family transcriptional regulator [Treponema sp.]
MQTQIKIEKCEKPYCVIHAEQKNEAINSIAEKISMMDESGRICRIAAWDGDFCVQLKQNEILRIYSMDKKVYVECEKEAEPLLLKLRLYEIEEMAERFGWIDFIRISNTDIVNFSKVEKLDMSLSGIIKVIYADGKNAIVSRRYMNKIKNQLMMTSKKAN